MWLRSKSVSFWLSVCYVWYGGNLCVISYISLWHFSFYFPPAVYSRRWTTIARKCYGNGAPTRLNKSNLNMLSMCVCVKLQTFDLGLTRFKLMPATFLIVSYRHYLLLHFPQWPHFYSAYSFDCLAQGNWYVLLGNSGSVFAFQSPEHFFCYENCKEMEQKCNRGRGDVFDLKFLSYSLERQMFIRYYRSF